MKVLRIIARLNVGGPARHAVLLDAGLRRRGSQTLLVHGRVADGEASFEHLADLHRIATFRVPSLARRVRVWNDIRAFVAILRVIFRERPDVVHSHTAKAGALGRVAAGIYNLVQPRRARCAVVHTFHGHVLEGYFGPLGSWTARFAERTLGLMTDCTIAISESLRRDLVERLRVTSSRRTVVVALGLDLRHLLELRETTDAGPRAALGLSPGDFVVGFVGRFVPIKNLSCLVRAVAHARANEARIQLVLVGDGPEREALGIEAARLDISERVHFLGWREELATVYRSLDVLVLSSMNEGTPVAIIEAMAAGIPVVATAVGGVPDVIDDGVTGLLTQPTPEAIAEAILRVRIENGLATARARRAREVVAERYDSERLAADIEGLYRRTVERKRGVPPAETAVDSAAAS